MRTPTSTRVLATGTPPVDQSKEIDMNASDIYRYRQRGQIDTHVDQMRTRIIAERRSEIGVMAATQEAIQVTGGWYRAQYERIENEVETKFGFGA